MKKITTNLATLKSPWNCPHGRPTMIKLPNISLKSESSYRNITPINFED